MRGARVRPPMPGSPPSASKAGAEAAAATDSSSPPGDGGGTDAGPTPHDLYDASLAACKALTVLAYARRKGIPVGCVNGS